MDMLPGLGPDAVEVIDRPQEQRPARGGDRPLSLDEPFVHPGIEDAHRTADHTSRHRLFAESGHRRGRAEYEHSQHVHLARDVSPDNCNSETREESDGCIEARNDRSRARPPSSVDLK